MLTQKLRCVSIFVFVFLVSLTTSIAQEKDISGQIENIRDIEGIHILNISTKRNTITDAKGRFAIKVNLNDTLFFSAIAYNPELHIITQEEYTTQQLNIRLKGEINELDEVKIGNQLSGNLPVDAKNNNPDAFNLSDDLTFEKMEFEYKFTEDRSSSYKGNVANEAYYNGQKLNDGVKLQEIIPAIFKYLKRNKTPEELKLHQDDVVAFLKEKYKLKEITSRFNIPQENAEDFIYFVGTKGVPQTFFLEENELILTQYLLELSLLYEQNK